MIFPSDYERTIATTLIGFSLGLLLGLLLNLGGSGAEALLDALITLFAAFLGAMTAFLLENRARKRKQRLGDLNAANTLMYMLYERLNNLAIFQNDSIKPHRGSRGIAIEMAPIPDFRGASSDLDPKSVAFLFNTKYKDVMFKIHLCEEIYSEAINLIRRRSSLHLLYQSSIAAAGHLPGDPLTEADVQRAMGVDNYAYLVESTDRVVAMVDRFMDEADSLRKELISVFSDLFSGHEVFAFKLLVGK